MNASENKQLIKDAYRRFMEGDIEGVLGMFDDDCDCDGPNLEGVPFADCYHGKEALRQYFERLGAAQDVARFEPIDFIAEGDKVVVTGSATWHVKSTGLDYDSEWAHVFTVRGGKVARFQQYVDTAATEHAFQPAARAPLSHQASV